MKPTQLQIENLQRYLHDTLSYRETYEEIYDHILSALEYQPDHISYQDAVNNIINNDFGSYKNLLKVEKISKEALVKESVNRYLMFYLDYFKFPKVTFIVISSMVTYYLLKELNFGAVLVEILFAFSAIIAPGVIMMLRLFSTGYILDTTSKSARDKMFENFAGGPIRLMIIIHFWIFNFSADGYKLPGFEEWFKNNCYIITAILILTGIYNLALYKLYKHEFKTSLAL